MKNIFNVFFRAYLKNPARTMGLILSIAFGIGIWGAMDMAFKSIPFTLDKFYEKTEFSGLEIRFLADDENNIPDISQIDGVKAVEHRLILPCTVMQKEKTPLTSLLILTRNSNVSVNALSLKSGRLYNPGTDEVVIERSLNEYHNYKTGDPITFKVGEKIINSKISGIAISPEFFSMSSNPDFAIPEKGTLGVGYGNFSVFNDALGFTLVNDIVITYKDGADIEKTKGEIFSCLKGLNIDKVMNRDDQFSHQQIMFNLSGYKSNGWAMIVALILLSVFVSLLTFNRIIIETRKIIGNLYALGYSKGNILRVWLLNSILLGIAAGLIACIIAVIQRVVIAESFGLILGLPFIKYYIDFSTIIVCIFVSIIIAISTSLFPLILLLRKSPRSILTPEINVHDSPKFVISATNLLLNHLPVEYRYGIRNLFRRPVLALFATLLIGFAISVSIAYGLSTTSYNKSMFSGLEQEKWDYVVDFTHPVFKEDYDIISKHSGISQVSPYFRGFVEAGANGKFIDTRILGIQTQDSMRITNVISGEELQKGPENGVIIAKDIARDLKLRVGDSLTAKYQDLISQLKVAGISGDLNVRQMTMNYKKAQELCGFPERAKGLYIKTLPNGAFIEINKSYIAKITSYQQMHNSLKKVWDESLVIVYVATGFCSAMVIIFLAMFIMLTISERDVEYAILMSAGYDRSSILKIIFSETISQVVIAIIISIPMGILLSLFLNYRLSQSFFQVQFSYLLLDFVKSPVIAFLIAIGVAYSGANSVIRKEIAPRLRNREIG